MSSFDYHRTSSVKLPSTRNHQHRTQIISNTIYSFTVPTIFVLKAFLIYLKSKRHKMSKKFAYFHSSTMNQSTKNDTFDKLKNFYIHDSYHKIYQKHCLFFFKIKLVKNKHS